MPEVNWDKLTQPTTLGYALEIVMELAAIHERKVRFSQGWTTAPATDSLRMEYDLFDLAGKAAQLIKKTNEETNG